MTSRNDRIALFRKWTKQKGKCYWCDKDVPLKKATRDHVVPRSKGGLNIFRNVVMSCEPCNHDKDNLDPGPLLWLRFAMRTGLL